MNQSPIPKALSILFRSRTRALLMGGQACILYGAAEFSRDVDLAIQISSDNLHNLRAALAELQAGIVYVPELNEEALLRGHACHFRCNAPGVQGLRLDVMGKMRGVADFPELWERREEINLPDVGPIPVMALEDLVRAKKTQRDKDWPMIRRLIEADFYRQGPNAPADRITFWLAECRTPEILQSLAGHHPERTQEMAEYRPLLNRVLAGDLPEVAQMPRAEEDRERERDRQYWTPLRKELEEWRREKR